MPCFWQPLPVVLSTWVQSHEIHSLGQGYRLDSCQFISRSQLNLTGTMHPRWKLEFWTDVRMIMASPLVWKDAFQQSCSAVTLLTLSPYWHGLCWEQHCGSVARLALQSTGVWKWTGSWKYMKIVQLWVGQNFAMEAHGRGERRQPLKVNAAWESTSK